MRGSGVAVISRYYKRWARCFPRWERMPSRRPSLGGQVRIHRTTAAVSPGAFYPAWSVYQVRRLTGQRPKKILKRISAVVLRGWVRCRRHAGSAVAAARQENRRSKNASMSKTLAISESCADSFEECREACTRPRSVSDGGRQAPGDPDHGREGTARRSAANPADKSGGCARKRPTRYSASSSMF